MSSDKRSSGSIRVSINGLSANLICRNSSVEPHLENSSVNREISVSLSTFSKFGVQIGFQLIHFWDFKARQFSSNHHWTSRTGEFNETFKIWTLNARWFVGWSLRLKISTYALPNNHSGIVWSIVLVFTEYYSATVLGFLKRRFLRPGSKMY